MLTTYDLYKRPGYDFKLNDLVEFKLLKGYKLRMHHTPEICKRGVIAKAYNKNSNKSKFRKNFHSFKFQEKNSNETIIGTVVDYYIISKLKDLEIKLIREDRCEIKLKLSQCKDLKILS